MDRQQANNIPTLCANGCGFFGNPLTANMCSKCYKSVTSQQGGATQSTSAASPAPVATASLLTMQMSDAHAMEVDEPAPAPMAAAVTAAIAETLSPNASSAPMSIATSAHTSHLATSADDSSFSASTPPATVLAASPSMSALPPTPPQQKNTSRCWSCKKKIGLTGFKCRCGFYFCSQHRYSDAHSCTVDYKTLERDKLREANPVVMGSKLEKI